MVLAAACALLLSCTPANNGSGVAPADADPGHLGDAAPDTESESETTDDEPILPATCEEAAAATTTLGCTFYAVDLDNYDVYENAQFAVAVSNPSASEFASVEVHVGEDGGWTLLEAANVAPMAMQLFELPPSLFATPGLMTKGSFKITASIPIAAYQFNPLISAGSYTSDASVLIPTDSLSETYEIVGIPQVSTDSLEEQAYFVVVAASEGTEVTITASVSPLAGEGVPSQTEPFVVPMGDGDVLSIQSQAFGDSFTGTLVVTNPGHPVAVFSGHECARIPSDICCCDHLEEQLPGVRFWGTEIVAAQLPPRAYGEPQTEDARWQIIASEDGTEVTFSASATVAGLPAGQLYLDAGEVAELDVHGTDGAAGNFLVTADKPVGVVQYMTSSQNPLCNDLGDPSMVYMSPTEQFLPKHVVLVPPSWDVDVLVLTRWIGAATYLDDELVPDAEFSAVGESGYEVALIPVDDGVHAVRSGSAQSVLGVMVAGMDGWDSYAYSGGMGMFAINPDVE